MLQLCAGSKCDHLSGLGEASKSQSSLYHSSQHTLHIVLCILCATKRKRLKSITFELQTKASFGMSEKQFTLTLSLGNF